MFPPFIFIQSLFLFSEADDNIAVATDFVETFSFRLPPVFPFFHPFFPPLLRDLVNRGFCGLPTGSFLFPLLPFFLPQNAAVPS